MRYPVVFLTRNAACGYSWQQGLQFPQRNAKERKGNALDPQIFGFRTRPEWPELREKEFGANFTAFCVSLVLNPALPEPRGDAVPLPYRRPWLRTKTVVVEEHTTVDLKLPGNGLGDHTRWVFCHQTMMHCWTLPNSQQQLPPPMQVARKLHPTGNTTKADHVGLNSPHIKVCRSQIHGNSRYHPKITKRKHCAARPHRSICH